ncbi:uncharacterized protein LOC116219649 [Clupea harengus]|uniref:Uncharacterized protein LOC116219649 n=1 Tax=Clupea harengus TaxID=7950 RepID=A0A6P8ESL9_CLUHA|nr:uncharacterized protein LOC116219649 [Clupea harengus]XP_042559703.1 uncharacterized protein LOC116219649 [Clupea harengus]
MPSTRTLSLLVQVVFVHYTAGSPVSVFRPTGGSATLEFQGHQQLEKKSIDLIQWYFGLEKIMKYSPLRDTVTVFTHQDRVEFNKETFSLELKNLQKNDSGLYRGEISAVKTEVKVEYMLSVLDPVESPGLSVVSNWTSCDSCYVTCKGHDLSLTSACNCSTCSPEEEHSTDSNLTLSVRSGVVICNYSNQVSWSNDAKDIKLLCPTDPVESPVLSVVSNWTSCDACNVTCKGHDLSLTSTCNYSTCSPEGGASTDSTLSLSVRSGVVICNYSNLVSWSNDTKDFKLLCCTEQSVPAWIGIIIAIAILGVAVLIALLWRKSANPWPIRCCREPGETHSETGTGG